jgi:hypothetical protein
MTTSLEKVLQWASSSTGEGRRSNEGYYWTLPVNSALFRLTHYESYFIGLVGLVGTGKSSAILALQKKIEDTIHERFKTIAELEVQKENKERIDVGALPLDWTEESTIRDKYCKKVLIAKWHEDLWTMFQGSFVGTSSYLKYQNAVIRSLEDTPKGQKLIKKKEDYIKSYTHQQLRNSKIHEKTLSELRSDQSFEEAQKMLPAKVLKRIRTDAIFRFLKENIACILIDMPDYSQKGCWKINKDLDGIGELWNLLTSRRSEVNILVCLQQELVMNQPHMILGKMDKIILKTLTIEQLLEAYNQFFESYEPFTAEALRLIAKLSRGVFRRFKSYVRLCLELVSIEGGTNSPISIDSVKRAITKDQLKLDMDLELSEFFKNAEKKLQAFNILDFVRDNPTVSQKVISEALDLHPNAVGDVVKQLCLHNYLQVKRGKGTELLVSLKE